MGLGSDQFVQIAGTFIALFVPVLYPILYIVIGYSLRSFGSHLSIEILYVFLNLHAFGNGKANCVFYLFVPGRQFSQKAHLVSQLVVLPASQYIETFKAFLLLQLLMTFQWLRENWARKLVSKCLLKTIWSKLYNYTPAFIR